MTMAVEKKIGQKVILTRNRQSVIKKNLTHMEQAAHKKKLAQQWYYAEAADHSTVVNEENPKPPVHFRLGKESQNNIEPQLPVARPTPSKFRWRGQYPQGIFTRKYRNLMQNQRNGGPKSSAQRRLDRIRPGFKQYNMQKVILTRKRAINSANAVRNGSNPLTFRVQLNNNQAYENRRHSLRAAVDQSIQSEIKIIQSQNLVSESIPNLPIYGGGHTKLSIHDRFSNYP